MTAQAELLDGLAELRVVLCAVYVVTGSAGDAVLVHNALHEIIALHPVLVRGSVRKVSEGRLSEGVVFEHPEVCEMQPNPVADRPVIGLAFDPFLVRLALRMALDAGNVVCHVVHLRRFKDVGA